MWQASCSLGCIWSRCALEHFSDYLFIQEFLLDSSGLGRAQWLRKWLCVKGKSSNHLHRAVNCWECWFIRFFFLLIFFSPIIDVQEHTEDISLVHTNSLHWDLLFCRKNMTLLQQGVKSGGIKAHVHPGTEPHSGTCSRSFSALSCAAPLSQSSQLEPEAMEHLFLIR